jgi:predicted 3-demethylubiquinone-9 3-methyltransferase (glyoxalase superfamily)
MNKVTPFLMFNDQLEAAIEFYTATFPNSEVRNVTRTGKDGVPSVPPSLSLVGQLFMATTEVRTSASLRGSRSTWTARIRMKWMNTGTSS